MKSFARIPKIALAAILLLTGIGAAGCADAVTSTHATPPAAADVPSKMRQTHLLGGRDAAGKVLDRYWEYLGYQDFVVGITPTVLNMQRVLDRYSGEAGVTITRSYKKVFKGFAMHLDASQLDRLLNIIELDPDIAWMEPDVKVYKGTPNSIGIKGNKSQILPWGVDQIDADLSFTRAGDGRGSVDGVDLFILDSGISNNDVNVVGEYNFLLNAPTPNNDKVGHGTHVAGIAAAIDDNDDAVGVAPGARVHNYVVLDDQGQTDLSVVISAVEAITELKAQSPSTPMVVNMSFGAYIGTTEYNALDEAIAVSIAQGVVYVLAAGNDGLPASQVTPAHVAGAITVGAYDQSNRFYGFSNYGPTVDILAPGVDIISLYSTVTSTSVTLGKMSGTSMAAPHVTGAAALYLAQHPTATPQQVRDALLADACASVTGVPSGTTNKAVYVNGVCPVTAGGDTGTGGNGKGKGGR